MSDYLDILRIKDVDYDIRDSGALHPSDVDSMPTEDSTNPVQSSGVYSALLEKATRFYTPDITDIPPTILNRLKVGDIVSYGNDANASVTVAVIDEQNAIIILAHNDGMEVGVYQYQNGICTDTALFSLSDMANKVSGATNGHLAGLDSSGELTDSGIAASDVATTSDLSGFITNSVNDLTNYYLKSETYTKDEVAALIGAIQQFHYEIYATLPQSGENNVLYLIGPTGSGTDRYEEYVYSNNAFTKIGDTSIDLSNYVTTSALNTALANYTTTANLNTLLAGKQDTLTFDEIPTEDSTNPVQSGGVYWVLSNLIANGGLYGGVVIPSDEPIHGDDHRYFYLAFEEGRYVNFNNLEIQDYVAILYWSDISNNWARRGLWYNDEKLQTLLGLKQDTISDIATIRSGAAAGATAYQKPSGGIPASDLAQAVQTSLGKADTALQSYTETDPTVPSWAKQSSKPTYTAREVGAVSDVTVGGTSVVTNGVAVVPSIPDVSGKADKVVYVDASTPPSTMDANKVYQYGTLSGDTTFPAFTAVSSGDTEVKIWCWTFTTPSTAPTITWPAGITAWNGGSAPTINASKNYEVSVMDGVACIIETDIPT